MRIESEKRKESLGCFERGEKIESENENVRRKAQGVSHLSCWTAVQR